VLPVSLYCKGKVKPFRSVTLRIGRLIKNEELGMEKAEPRAYHRASEVIMGRIAELWRTDSGHNTG